MKCKCGNDIKIGMLGKAKSEGCKILTAMTTIITGQCEKCGIIFQVPISSNDVVVKED